MPSSTMGLALMVKDPTAAGRWFADHVGFTVVVDLGRCVTTRHDGHEHLSVDFMTPDAHAWPDRVRGQAAAGTLLAVDPDPAWMAANGLAPQV